MENLIEGHISGTSLEEYSLDRLTKILHGTVEEHLLICAYCRNRLAAIEPLNFVHMTEDGPIYSRVTRLMIGQVIARHWGKELDGMRICGSVALARKYLDNSFSKMFPEHSCESSCGSAQEPGNRYSPYRLRSEVTHQRSGSR